jgi:hypothetical protein
LQLNVRKNATAAASTFANHVGTSVVAAPTTHKITELLNRVVPRSLDSAADVLGRKTRAPPFPAIVMVAVDLLGAFFFVRPISMLLCFNFRITVVEC